MGFGFSHYNLTEIYALLTEIEKKGEINPIILVKKISEINNLIDKKIGAINSLKKLVGVLIGYLDGYVRSLESAKNSIKGASYDNAKGFLALAENNIKSAERSTIQLFATEKKEE